MNTFRLPMLASFVVATAVGPALANDKEAHELRVSTDLLQLFQSLDRDGDGVVTTVEAAGDVNFLPQFRDIDINRDDNASVEELSRFIEQTHGVRLKTP